MSFRDTTTTELLVTAILALATIFVSGYAAIFVAILPPLILGLTIGQVTGILIRRHQRRD